jgi:hypothetical protein
MHEQQDAIGARLEGLSRAANNGKWFAAREVKT